MSRSLWSVCSALLLLVGCSVTRFPDVVARQPVAYRYSASADGVEVAADPYLEEQRIVEHFGTNLLSAGILPVHLVVHNGTGAPLLFVPRNVAVYSAFDHAELPMVSVEAAQAPLVKERQEYNDIGGVAFIMMNPLLGWAADHSAQEADVIARNIARKHIFQKTIFDGETHSGFVYFTDKDTARLVSIEKLILSIGSTKTNKTVSVVVSTQ